MTNPNRPALFAAKVRRLPSGCWQWTGAIDKTGYGRFTIGRGRSQAAHRFAYELHVGPILPGLDLDHLCRNRWCVNPAHLEPVTRSVNLSRRPLPLQPYPVRQSKTSRPQGVPWEQRFWAKVNKTPGCWLWTAATSKGYGSFGMPDRRQRLAHRLSYELLVGPIPEGLVLDHLCRVRNCVNPAHLEPVTAAENTRRGLLRTRCHRGHVIDETPTGRRCKTCAAIQWRTWAQGAGRERLEAKRLARNTGKPRGRRPKSTHCVHGHPYDEENTRIDSRGRQNCRTCARENMRRRREAQRA